MALPTDVFLTETQLNNVFWSLTMQLLGYDPAEYSDSTNLPTAMPVRISWQSEGAPAWKITEDICSLRIIEIDDSYNRPRNITFSALDDDNLTQEMAYTRVIQVDFVFRGPNAFDHAAIAKDRIFYQEYHDILYASNLYLILDIPAPIKAPELFQNQWWKRVDLTMQFNELVVRNIAVPIIKSATVTVETEDPGGNIDSSDVEITIDTKTR
jgi:hypothetical protein